MSPAVRAVALAYHLMLRDNNGRVRFLALPGSVL